MAETQESVIREIWWTVWQRADAADGHPARGASRLGKRVGRSAWMPSRGHLSLPRVEVESTLSFYAFFSPKPRGSSSSAVCNDIIDQMHGVERVGRAFREELGIDFGQTTADGLFTLEHTPCIGMCDQAPAALINDQVVTNLSSDRARELVRPCVRAATIEHAEAHPGNGNNSHPLVRAVVETNLREREGHLCTLGPAGMALRQGPGGKRHRGHQEHQGFASCVGAGARASPPA